MAKDTQINSFSKGMNRDVANNKLPNEMYKYLENGKVLSEFGDSSFAITNEKGNKRSFVIPEVPLTQFITQIDTVESGFISFNLNIILNDGTTFGFTAGFDDNPTLQGVYNFILNQPGTQAAIDEGSLIISYSSTYNTLHIMAPNGTSAPSGEPIEFFVLGELFTSVINEPHTPNIIGGGDFDDNYVIFTSSDDGWGQIWYLIYDKQTDQVQGQDALTLELNLNDHLKYNNQCDFQSSFPIRRVISVKETESFGSIYWTDAYNTLRSLDILQPDSINVPITQINLNSESSYGNLQISKVSSNGVLPSGSTVQFTYRMVSGNGSRTNYAPLTDLFPLTDSNPYNHGGEFEGTTQDDDTLTNKAVSLEFQGLDTTYDRINIAAVVYRYKNIPEVYLETDIPIPSTGNISYLFTGQNSILESELELGNILDTISKVNDINVKDNRLIAMGISLEKKDLNWDARAYRKNILDIDDFPNTLLIDDQGNTEYYVELSDIVNGNVTIDKEADAINPSNYYEADGINYTDNDLYILDVNGNIGGSGLNIDYRIIGFELTALNQFEVPVEGSDTNPGTFTGGLTLSENEFLDLTGELRNYKSPKVSAYLKGYQRGEIYRFGIKFYDKGGNAYPVKWIGDIKFPGREEEFDHKYYKLSGSQEIETTKTNGDLHYRGTDGKVYMETLGIEFTIKNLDQISNDISGFTITRCPRTQLDKSILADGYMMPFVNYDNDTEIAHLPVSPDHATLLTNYENDGNPVLWDDTSHVCFLTPEAHNSGNRFQYSEGDTFVMSRNVHCTHHSEAVENAGFNVRYGYNLGSGAASVQSGEAVTSGFKNVSINAMEFANIDDQDIELSTGTTMRYRQSRGGAESPALGFLSSGVFSIFGSTTAATNLSISYWSTTAKYIAEVDYDLFTNFYSGNNFANRGIPSVRYRKSEFKNHYGGRSYEARKNSIYIDCTDFQPINNPNNDKTIKVFRGDTTCHLWDVLWGGFNGLNYIIQGASNSSQEEAWQVGLIMVVESSYNLDYRSEERFLHDKNGTLTNSIIPNSLETRGISPSNFEAIESYEYNNAYDQKNSLVTYLPESSNRKITTELPASVWPSEPKILGENIDSWRSFLPNNLYDLDAIYGPINRGEIFNNELLTLQTEAVALIPINERIMINDESSTQVVLGTGNVIGKHRYVTINSGTNQPFSVVNTDTGIYYLDPLKGKFCMMGRGKQDISTVAGMDSEFQRIFRNSTLLEDVDPLNFKVAACAVDQLDNRIYITTIQNAALDPIENPDGSQARTIVYNERLGAFEHEYGDKALMYYTNGSSIITPRGNKGYLHKKGIRGQFYDREELAPVIIKFVINKHAPLTKVFNNLEFHFDPLTLEDDHYNNITVDTYDQSTVSTKITKRFRTYRHVIGRDKADQKSRMQGPWAEVTITLNNKDDVEFILQDIISHFDVYNLAAQ